MKILLLTSDFLPNIGGMASHALELARALVGNGHTVHLLHPVYGQGENHDEDIDGFTVHRMFFSCTLPKIKHVFYIRGVRDAIRRLHRAIGFDVLHWHDLTPNCWTTRAFAGRVPLVWTNHTSNYLEYVESEKGRRTMRRFLGHADAIISPSNELFEKSVWTGVPPERLHYIPNGVDTRVFAPGRSFGVLDKDYAIDVSRPIIICPRRLEPKNGVEYLIRAVPTILSSEPRALVLIVGGGFPEEKERFERMLEESGARSQVIFTGNVPNTLMPQFLSMAQVAVLPSLMEATSIAGLEAMAMGLPLVGTRVGGIPEIIDDGVTGMLVEPRNPASLAAACIRLLRDEDLRRRIGKAARERAEREFSWSTIAERTCKVYEQARHRRGGG